MTEAKKDMRTSAPITLDFPIEVDGEKIETLTMRRPKVRDGLKAERASGSDADKRLAFLADLCDRPPEVLHELDETDLEKVNDQYLAFTGRMLTPEN